MRSGFAELAKKAQKGDSAAFAELYSAVYKELYYYALCNLNTADDAADAVQSTVTDALAGIKNIRTEDAFKVLMLRILTEKIKLKRAEYAAEREIGGIPNKEPKYGGIELLDYIESLDEDEKMCFSLNAIYGYTSDEISRITGFDAAAVRTHLASGKAKMRRLLKDN